MIGNCTAVTFAKRNTSPFNTHLNIEGTLTFKGTKIVISSGCAISVAKGGCLTIGDRVNLSPKVRVQCRKKIVNGDQTRISWETQIFDTNFHYLVNAGSCVKPCNGEVIIGNRCWIGNRVTIQKGAHLPDYTIVASNSLVNKDFTSTEKPTIGGIPAKLLTTGQKRVFNMRLQTKLNKFFAEHPDAEETYIDAELSDKPF